MTRYPFVASLHITALHPLATSLDSVELKIINTMAVPTHHKCTSDEGIQSITIETGDPSTGRIFDIYTCSTSSVGPLEIMGRLSLDYM